MYEKNHELMNYDFIEADEFDGLMPKVIDSVGGVGTNENQPNVKFMCGCHGHDQMQTVDIEKYFDDSNLGG